MSTYREIHGKAVKSVSTDPSATTDAGQIWYNTSSDTFKSIVALSAWSSASPMTLEKAYRFGGGTPTAAFAAGGSPYVATTEEYNGSGWSAGGDIGTPRAQGGSAGTLTAGLIFGGYFNPPASTKDNTEEYNGTSWTAQNVLTSPRYSQGGFGIQTAAVYTNGYFNPPSGTVADTEEYNGTSWSEGNNSSTLRMDVGTAGTLTAGMIFGGQSPPPAVHANTELYDGTNWTTGPSMNSARSQLGGSGTQTSALAYGGRYLSGPGIRALTEAYDGTSWSETADLATATRCLSSPKSNTGNSAALAIGGLAPSATAKTEEFNNSATVITAAAWSSGTNFPTTSSAVAGAGPRDAAIGIGGYPAGSPPTGKSFEYDGTSWSSEQTLNSNTGTLGVSSATGTQTACICAQQGPGPAPPYKYYAAGEYDGSSWSNANDRPGDNYSQAMSGTQTAGLLFGGTSSPTGTMNITLSYDGTNWTAEEAMNTARSELAGSGTATAALGSGGYSNPPATYYANTEEYGGESWTASNALLYVVRNGRSSGTQTDAIYMGGGTPSLPLGTVNCATYDGTSWATAPSMATSRQNQGNGATSPVGAAWGAAGYSAPGSPNRTNTTEHFTTETTAINVKTLTQS